MQQPRNVQIAVILLAVSFAAGFVNTIRFALDGQMDSWAWVTTAVTALFWASLLYACWHGFNSARIVLAIVVALSVPSNLLDLVAMQDALEALIRTINGALHIAGAIMLFLPASAPWFQRHRIFKHSHDDRGEE